MRKSCPFPAVPVCILSVILFTALTPWAHAGPIENLVFTESGSQLTETLNGVSIGNWGASSSDRFNNSTVYGDVTAQPGAPEQYAWLQFADPANSGEVLFLSLAGILGNAGAVDTDIPLDVAPYFAPMGMVYPDTLNTSSSLPFSMTDATVDTAQGRVDVNISFVTGPDAVANFDTVPDGVQTSGLLLAAGVALAVAGSRFKTAQALPARQTL